MLASKYRFHSRGGVKYTYQKGKTIRTPKLSLIYAPNSRKKQRFAVVISKKVLKSAVGRNRIRRRLYEVIRLELANFHSSYDCIFVVFSKELANLPFSKLQELVRTLLSQTVL